MGRKVFPQRIIREVVVRAPSRSPSLAAAFTRRVLLTLAITLAASSISRADDFFNITAIGSGGAVASSSGGNIIHLTDNLISLNSSFITLAGQNVNSTLSWGGIPDAVLFSENASQTVATIYFPTTGYAHTFTGANAADLQNQIHDFLKGNGDKAYANFLQSMNRYSAVATLDGNPQSSTALISTDVFTHLGIQNQQPTDYVHYSDGAFIGISADGGLTRADGLNGTWVDANIDSGIRFGSHVALSLGTTLAFRNTESSQAYTVAEELALPITLINANGNGLSWQVAPWAFAGLTASYDQAAGGILVGGGGTSSLAFHYRGLTLTLGDQISYTGDVDANVDGYAFDTDIDQWILKNGLDAMYQIPGTPLFVEGGITYSNFFRPAAVPDYWTPTAGVGLAMGKYSCVRFEYQGDLANHYTQTGGEIQFVVVY
jgi:hypothetical protein